MFATNSKLLQNGVCEVWYLLNKAVPATFKIHFITCLSFNVRSVIIQTFNNGDTRCKIDYFSFKSCTYFVLLY